MLEYKARRNILHKGTEVITGSSKDEAAVLYVMKKLVVGKSSMKYYLAAILSPLCSLVASRSNLQPPRPRI